MMHNISGIFSVSSYCANVSQIRHISYKKFRTWYAGLVKPRPSEPPHEHIVQIGDPSLRAPTDEVPPSLIHAKEIKFLIRRMRDVFEKYSCVGLSAPQIGIGVKIIMFEFNERHAKFYGADERKIKEMSLVPFTVVINPVIKVTDYTKVTFPEACESVRGFYADVPRFRGIQLKGYDENAKDFTMEARGWPARIIQHEVDHINGKVYTDVMETKTLTCSCWEVVNERGGRVEMPYGSS